MATSWKTYVLGENRILGSVSRKDYKRLEPDLTRVTFGLKDVLYESDRSISHVYFPLSGVMSLVIETENGPVIEVGTIGNEGMVGMPLFFGVDRSPAKAFCQVPGECLQMEAEAFRRALRRIPKFDTLLQRYAQALMNQLAQSVVCNRAHEVQQRMCRWLLMTHDRAGVDEFALTQEFLAQMLGVRRATVTVTAGLLQRRGLISYSRGRVTVVDRNALEETACECYETVRAELDRLFE